MCQLSMSMFLCKTQDHPNAIHADIPTKVQNKLIVTKEKEMGLCLNMCSFLGEELCFLEENEKIVTQKFH